MRKKKCEGCKALQDSVRFHQYSCGLGHKIRHEYIKIYIGEVYEEVPVPYADEPCEKPRTITKYCELGLEKSRKNKREKSYD